MLNMCCVQGAAKPQVLDVAAGRQAISSHDLTVTCRNSLIANPCGHVSEIIDSVDGELLWSIRGCLALMTLFEDTASRLRASADPV